MIRKVTVAEKEEVLMESRQNRRQFLQAASLGAAASLAGGPGMGLATASAMANSTEKPTFELGMASYTLRKFDLDTALKMTNRLALKHISLKDFHLALDSSPEQIAAAAAKVKAAGIDLYAGGVIYMKTEQQVRQGFAYAKAAGMKIIVGVPNHDLLGLVEEMVKQYDIKVAIHNHGPGDRVYPVSETAYELIKNLDKRIGLCLDIGHTMRSGIDPSEPAQKYVDRLLDVHIKDVSAATGRGSTVEIGRGVINIPKFLRTLVRIDYAGIVSFEHEKDENDPLPGVAESVGYVRGVLATI
jgi:sugar phosphate isomerase/epimerase